MIATIHEKMQQTGAQSLSTPELFAVILGHGTARESALVLCDRLFKDYGGRRLPADVEMLMREGGVSRDIACKLAAAFEFVRRAAPPPGDIVIRTAKDLFTHAADMGALKKEHLRGFYLNAKNKVIHEETVSIGTLTATLVHPAEVFRPAIERSAAGVIVAHNHPSGDPEPSDHDLTITAQLAQAASILSIKLIDHIIITSDRFVSLRERGVL